MLNDITICGRLTAKPELHQTQSGVPVTSFTVAVERDYKQGDEKITDFLTVSAWRGSAEYAAKYGDKGRMVVVQGSMQSRQFTDKEGNKRTAWEIESRNIYLVDNRRDNAEVSSTAPSTADADGSDLPF